MCYNTGDFAFDTIIGANVQILERIEMWGYISYKVFNPITGQVYKASDGRCFCRGYSQSQDNKNRL